MCFLRTDPPTPPPAMVEAPTTDNPAALDALARWEDALTPTSNEYTYGKNMLPWFAYFYFLAAEAGEPDVLQEGTEEWTVVQWLQDATVYALNQRNS